MENDEVNSLSVCRFLLSLASDMKKVYFFLKKADQYFVLVQSLSHV